MNHHFSPCRKLSWVLFVWGQIHLIPLIQQLQEGCQPERGQQNTAPICVQSWDPSGCNTRSVLNDTSRAVLTGHLLHQHYSALFVGRYPKLGAQRMPHCQALALHSGAHPTASLRNTGIKQVSYALRLFEWASEEWSLLASFTEKKNHPYLSTNTQQQHNMTYMGTRPCCLLPSLLTPSISLWKHLKAPKQAASPVYIHPKHHLHSQIHTNNPAAPAPFLGAATEQQRGPTLSRVQAMVCSPFPILQLDGETPSLPSHPEEVNNTGRWI